MLDACTPDLSVSGDNDVDVGAAGGGLIKSLNHVYVSICI